MWIIFKVRLWALLCVMSLALPVICIAQDQIEEAQLQPSSTAETKRETSTDSPQIARDQFSRDKEQRLEDLRYKHLWIAYSLVWVVIFLFIRQTWQRSQAVAGRLDELKTRLAALEEERS